MRKFYLIGHNPNSVGEAIRCLEAGANALEPDVCWDADDRAFYVHEEIPLIPTWAAKWFRKSLRLEDYLKGIGAYLKSNNRDVVLPHSQATLSPCWARYSAGLT
ncbi:MAG: hypothetical protein ABR961_14375 [Thermoanaerobaculaceae bacterium]|jgi:hypothetical protein